MFTHIFVKGAKEHNLKNLTLTIPRDAITVITGPSGSGKSSLAIDTIYAEGQRRYVESLSSYARQFLQQMQKPNVDLIEGLSASIAIDQKTAIRNPRSTVGTITEVYDYLRVLFTRLGEPHCYKCGHSIGSQDISTIIKNVCSLPEGSRVQVLAPIVRERKGEYKKELASMLADGFVRARIDGKMVDLTSSFTLQKSKRHSIEIVIDRLIVKPSIDRGLRQAIEIALRYSDMVIVNLLDEDRDILYSSKLACPKCGISYPEIEPMLFSFNSKNGYCPKCKGLGIEHSFDDESEIEAVSNHKPCASCQGKRLRPEATSILIEGKSIADIAKMSALQAKDFLLTLPLTDRQRHICHKVIKEAVDRLSFMQQVGLGYLTLDRTAMSLSGGEAQRIRLAGQLGSALTGVLYVLDEPSIGLHLSDCEKLLQSLMQIRDAGNTVLIVEHDEQTIRSADYIIDMGPGAGKNGGYITASGTLDEIVANKASLTGRYLSGELRIEMPSENRAPKGFIEIKGANRYNLRNIDVKIPLGVFVCVTGVSGSGKSTLILETLYEAVKKYLNHEPIESPFYSSILGIEQIKRCLCVDQSPLGRTPRSNPATYTGIFTPIRDIFAQTKEARMYGFGPSRFSFNVYGGRCEVCQGDGLKKIEMHFLPDVYVTCDVCKGRRYNQETLTVKFKGKSIADVLDMTVNEAVEFFSAIPALRQKLTLLDEIGLGYLRLGQSATTLSGGEAQRIRLAKELAKKPGSDTLYILDEPTTGLHFSDISRLIAIINKLVDMGNTVIVIEHDVDVIKSADWVIDMGPGGGVDGGMIMAVGSPAELAKQVQSLTGRYLAKALNP